MSERNLCRLRANPEKVRVGLRPEGKGWNILITSKVSDQFFSSFAPTSQDVPRVMMNAIMWLYGCRMEGIDPYMDWAYEHPQNENQYGPRGEERREQDNDLMRSLGLQDHVNEVH